MGAGRQEEEDTRPAAQDSAVPPLPPPPQQPAKEAGAVGKEQPLLLPTVEAAAALQPPGLAAAAAAQDATAGFSRWMRKRRARSDTFGYCLALMFHFVTLKKYGSSMSPSHLLYFTSYTASMAVLLAWQRSGRPSYAAWREWVQAAIRIDVFFCPIRFHIWADSADSDPPTIAGWPLLSWVLAAPVLLANTMAVHLLLLPFAHSVDLVAGVAVQAACVARVMWGLAVEHRMCSARFFSHHSIQGLLLEVHDWCSLLLGPLSVRPLAGTAPGQPPTVMEQCEQVAGLLILGLGLLAQLAVQAAWEQRMLGAYRRQRARELAGQGRGQQAAQEAQEAARQAAKARGVLDRVLDRCSAWLVPVLGGLATSPTLLLALLAGFWDLMSLLPLGCPRGSSS